MEGSPLAVSKALIVSRSYFSFKEAGIIS